MAAAQDSRVILEDRIGQFGIDARDYALFPTIRDALNRHGPRALDELYDYVRRTPEVAGLFTTDAQMSRARSKQLDHWLSLFNGPLDPANIDSATRIGSVHANIGLAPKWYVGGYAKILSRVIVAMCDGTAGFLGRRRGKAIATMVKLALLDMQLALSAYTAAEAREREDTVARIGETLNRLAKGDFTTRLEGLPEAYVKIERDFERMRATMAEALAEVSGAAVAVSTGAAEIRQASDDLAHRTEQQAASLEESSAAMEDLSSGFHVAADNAREMAESVRKTQTDAEDGGTVVREAVQAMDGIQRSANEIGKIVDMIDGIAFQTNLLALNAGVEAARAGDAGRGFAVVANEVRALAQRSADAAHDIKQLIGDSATQVERGVDLVSRSGSAFERIIERIAGITSAVAGISTLTVEQGANLAQINGTVHEIDNNTQQNAAIVEQANAASRSLASEASRLEQLVRGFTLPGASSGLGVSGSNRVHAVRGNLALAPDFED